MKNEIQIVRFTDAVINAIYAGVNPLSQHGVDIFTAHCNEIGASYYGEPNENFSIRTAVMLAKAENNSIVYVENLS